MNEIAPVLWTQIWQVTAVAAIVFLTVRLLAKDKPHLAHMLWALVLIKCITPPTFSSHISLFSWLSADMGVPLSQPIDIEFTGEAERVANSGIATDAPGLNLWLKRDGVSGSASVSPALPVSKNPAAAMNWKNILVGVWLVGAAICLVWQGCRVLILNWRLKRKELPPSAEIDALVGKLSTQLGLRRKVLAMITSASIGPAVIGLFHPRILLPSAIVNHGSIEELEPLIAHELIHIRRGDLWWAVLQTLAGSLFWFHPLVRLAVAAISHESERSCDEETVASLGCPSADYARCLLNVLEQKHRLRSVPALPGVKPIEITSTRLERVMKLGHGSHKRTPWWAWGILIACCAFVLPGAALVFAQEASDAPNPQAVETEEADSLLPVQTQEELTGSTILALAYPIDDIINDMRKKHPRAEVQELELRLLKYLKGYLLHSVDPGLTQFVTKIHDGKLAATRTEAGHEKLKERLKQIRKYGLRQIVIEARVISCATGTFDELKWEQSDNDSFVCVQGVVHRKNAMQETVAQASFEAGDPMLSAEIVNAAALIGDSDLESERNGKYELREARKIEQPVSKVTLGKDELKALLKRVAQHEYSTPTVAMFDGQRATIRDSVQRPFVTSVIPVQGDGGQMAHQPQISTLSEGTEFRVSAASASVSEIQIDAEVMLSQITDVQTFSFSGSTAGSEVSIQLPGLSVNRLRFAETIDKGKTVVVRMPHPEDKKREMLFVMSPKAVDDADFPEPIEWKRPVKPDVVPVEDESASGQVLPAAFYLNRHANSSTGKVWKLSPEKRFDKICFENKVYATEAEIDSYIETHAAKFGFSPERWMGLITTENV